MSSTKRIVSGVLALALALTVVAPVAASAQAMSAYTFNANLTVGSRGADVVALQTFLEAKGFLTIPAGTAKGYFGALTRSSLAAYQVSKGITPSVGYFGPVTRAAVAAEMMAGGSTTGGTSTVPGCLPGAAFSSTTGQPCTTGTTGGNTSTGGLTGTEGSLDIRLASNPADNSNVRTQMDVPVYGLEIRARIAPVSVQTLDLQVAVSNSGSSENPATLINTIKVWDGSNVLATVPVTTSTFTKDQNQVYYVRIPGLNFLVPQDQTKTLTVSFSTNSIDSDRTVTIDGYQTSSVRAVSGNNVSSFYSIDGSGFTRTHTFKKPGTSSLTLSAAGNTLRSQNYRVNGTDTLTGVTLATFNLKSSTGESTLLTVNASTTASGTMPSTLYLYQGSTLLKSKTVASNGSVSFDNLDTTSGSVIPQSETPTTYTIKADFPSNTANGTFASTTVTSVVYQTPNGNSAVASGSSVTNANQYVYNQAAIFTLTGTPTISQVSDQNGRTTSIVATFNFNVTALGANVTLPTGSDFVVKFATSSAGVQYTANSVSATVIPNNNISDGSTAQVTVTASIASSSLPVSGLYTAYISSISWTAGTTSVAQTYGLDDMKTPNAVNNVK